jgi:hypothetical protein
MPFVADSGGVKTHTSCVGCLYEKNIFQPLPGNSHPGTFDRSVPKTRVFNQANNAQSLLIDLYTVATP